MLRAKKAKFLWNFTYSHSMFFAFVIYLTVCMKMKTFFWHFRAPNEITTTTSFLYSVSAFCRFISAILVICSFNATAESNGVAAIAASNLSSVRKHTSILSPPPPPPSSNSPRVNFALYVTETQTIIQTTAHIARDGLTHRHIHAHTKHHNKYAHHECGGAAECESAPTLYRRVFVVIVRNVRRAHKEKDISYDCIAWNYKYSIKRVVTKVDFWIWRRRPYAFVVLGRNKKNHNIYFSSFFHDLLSRTFACIGVGALAVHCRCVWYYYSPRHAHSISSQIIY